MSEILAFWEEAHIEQDILRLTGCNAEQETRTLHIQDYLQTPKKILIIGIGTGQATKDLVKDGHTVSVLDIAKKAINSVKDYVHKSYLSIYHLPQNEFDIVLSNHVIQHMHDRDFKNQTNRVIQALTPTGIYALQFITHNDDIKNNINTIENQKGGCVTRTPVYINDAINKYGAKMIFKSNPGHTKIKGLVSYIMHVKKNN